MKKNRKLMMALSFCIGALMFVTTAFADIASKSGYDQLKDAVKQTFADLSENAENLTLEATVTLKDNDKLLTSANMVQKIDNANSKTEGVTSYEYSNGKKGSTYSYTDSKMTVSYDSNSDTYYVNEFPFQLERKFISNPFEDDKVKDIEKIVDALVGNLKSHVMVNEETDGSKEFSSTLNESQIPALINAVSSYLFKDSVALRSMAREDVIMPELQDDIFIKHVAGRATVYGNGIIESAYATATLSGKDKDGNTHELAFEVLVKVFDVNSTTVAAPDLTNKKVEKNVLNVLRNTVTEKFIGKYKADVIIVKDDTFVKIGERIVEITQIEDGRVSGKYYEIYKDGYEDYASGNSFTFDAEIRDAFATFDYTDAEGNNNKGNISFDTYTGRIYFNINYIVKDSINDPIFSRVFDE